MTHTARPWRIDKDSLNVFANGLLAKVFGHIHNGNKKANAKLIAASPDLLLACEKAYEIFRDWEDEEDNSISNAISGLEQAIAKAKGRKED